MASPLKVSIQINYFGSAPPAKGKALSHTYVKFVKERENVSDVMEWVHENQPSTNPDSTV